MTREDKARAAAIAAIRERVGLDAAAGQECGRCANSQCRRPVPFDMVRASLEAMRERVRGYR